MKVTGRADAVVDGVGARGERVAHTSGHDHGLTKRNLAIAGASSGWYNGTWDQELNGPWNQVSRSLTAKIRCGWCDGSTRNSLATA